MFADGKNLPEKIKHPVQDFPGNLLLLVQGISELQESLQCSLLLLVGQGKSKQSAKHLQNHEKRPFMVRERYVEPEIVQGKLAQKIHHQFRIDIRVMVFRQKFLGPFVYTEV